jgi:HD-like signal output (HDOD) protein
MMELQMDRVKFGALVAAMDSGQATDLLAAEEATFGATHQDFGGALLSAWQVPLTLSMAAQHHHDPYQLPIAHRTIPLMVHVAERLVAASDRPFLLEDPAGEIDDESLATLRIAHDQLDGILALLPDTITEIKLIFGGH